MYQSGNGFRYLQIYLIESKQIDIIQSRRYSLMMLASSGYG